MKIQAKPHIYHSTWTRRNGYCYQYGIEGAPWIKHRLASDVKLPKHLKNLIDQEQAKKEPMEIEFNDTVTKLVPLVDVVTYERFNQRDSYRINIGWYSEDDLDKPLHYEFYYLDIEHPWHEHHELHKQHVKHLQSIQDKMNLSIHLPDEENHGHAHRVGYGPLKPEPS
jgi:hypothetical protein